MHVDELLDLPLVSATSDNEWIHEDVLVPEDWAQGRTSFGGISAGLIYQAISQHVADDRVLRSFTTNFVGPLNVGTPFSIEIELLRTGKNVSQFIGKAVQDGKVAVFCQACFGVPRESSIRVDNNEQHNMTVPKKGKFIPQIPKVTPKFLRHFDLSIAKGGLPFTRQKEALIHGWMRFKQPPKTINDAHIITLIDAWPPTLLPMLKWPAPASTVSWNLEFIHPHRALTGEDWFAYQADTRQAADGYGHTEATIWDMHGEVIAISRQTVAVFD